MKTSEKVAYIKGLMEGMELDMSQNTNKILAQMAEVLEELAATNNALTEENIKLKDYVEELDADLGDLEEFVYDCEYCGDDDDDFGFDDDDDDEFEYEDYTEDEDK